MSNGSMELMEEAQYLVMKENERRMLDEIAKGGGVTEASKGQKGQRIHAMNFWMS